MPVEPAVGASLPAALVLELDELLEPAVALEAVPLLPALADVGVDDPPALPAVAVPVGLFEVGVRAVPPVRELVGVGTLPFPAPAAFTVWVSVEVGPPSLPASLQNPAAFSYPGGQASPQPPEMKNAETSRAPIQPTFHARDSFLIRAIPILDQLGLKRAVPYTRASAAPRHSCAIIQRKLCHNV